MPAGHVLAQAVRCAVQFDFGDADEVPIARGADFAEARAPFNECVLQFTTPKSESHSHILILWRSQADRSTRLITACKLRNGGSWRTTNERTVTRTSDGFQYEGVGYEENNVVVQCHHAMALNAFYVLGCANVQTVDHDAPVALNKKRARTGKFPILTHKTLIVVADAAKTLRIDQGGTHASPRVHLRRGHIRRLDEARRVWVQPCVVGSKHGVVTKDYRVTTRAALGA